MHPRSQISIFVITILFIYSFLFYFQLTLQLKLDFYSFYTSAIAYLKGVNPYKTTVIYFLPKPAIIPENLNPPFFLQLFSPLARMQFKMALLLWDVLSLCLGVIGALLCFYIISSQSYFKKNWFVFLFIYLAMYSTLINTSYGQLGGILLFFIITGYYFFLQKNDYLSGILWGIIISLKLFPALLFIYVLNQKRYRVFFIMCVICLLAFLWPLIIKGTIIYSLYFKMISNLIWHGGNWNASISGFLFRIIFPGKGYHNILFIKLAYLSIYLCHFINLVYKKNYSF